VLRRDVAAGAEEDERRCRLAGARSDGHRPRAREAGVEEGQRDLQEVQPRAEHGRARDARDHRPLVDGRRDQPRQIGGPRRPAEGRERDQHEHRPAHHRLQGHQVRERPERAGHGRGDAGGLGRREAHALAVGSRGQGEVHADLPEPELVRARKQAEAGQLERRDRMTELAQAVVNGLQMGFLYALVAVGLTIIWGLMEMINFAHGEFLMLGMFGAWWLSATLRLDPLVAIVPIALGMYAFGVLVYRHLMRRVQGGDPFTQIFATIGLLYLLQNAVVAGFTSDYRFVNDTLLQRLGGARLTVAGVTFAVPLLLAAGLALLLFLILYMLIERTEFGLALQATSEDRDAARFVGIRPQRMFAVAWGVGAALVAVAGAIL